MPYLKGEWVPGWAMPRVRQCIVWHQRSDTNARVAGNPHAANLRIEEYKPGDPLPERHTAYAYQLGTGTFTPYSAYLEDSKRGKWDIEIESLSPMVYFGMPKEVDGQMFCEDDHGVLHLLEAGDTIEPLEKGEITISHQTPPKQEYPW